MKKTIILAMFAALCTLTAGCADDFKTVLNDKYYEDDTPSREPDITEQTLTLGSYNLWISGKGTGDYLWTNRRTVLAQSIVKNKWDIFGFQEANGTIQNELPTLVGQQGGKYEWWFVGRDSQDGVSGEALGIAYNPERFELTDKHFFWISPTPDEMSYGWDELGYHRIAACAMVTDKLYNKQFFMMVTHAPLGATARAEGAKLLIEREKMYNPDGIPSILVGDMNAAMDDASSKTLRTHWNDSFLTVESDFISGPVGTFNGHKITADLTQATARIDYIYSRGDVELKSYKVDNTVYGNIYPSDHCPLTIQFDTDYEKPAPDVVEGSGTAADPWQLNSVSDWNTVAASINRQAEDAVYTSSAYYRLTADIDFDNKNLTPIGFAADNTIYFEGEFDGAGHKLLNVKLVAPGKSCGVFGANKGTIRDLAVEGALSTEFEIAGGIVGAICANENDSHILSCTNYGKITSKNSVNTKNGATGFSIGGIVGFADASTATERYNNVVGCVNEGAIDAQATRTAGVVATMNKYTKLENCANNAAVTCSDVTASNSRVAGIVSAMGGHTYLTSCVNNGTVAFAVAGDTTHGYAAGIAGQTNDNNTAIDGCENYGAVLSDIINAAANKYIGIVCANTNKKTIAIRNCKVGGRIGPFSDGQQGATEITEQNFEQYIYFTLTGGGVPTLENNSFSGGPAKPGIATVEDLTAFRDAVNAGESTAQWEDAGGVVSLLGDIDMKDVAGWTPIGNASYKWEKNLLTIEGNAFKGTFDGQGYALKNLKLAYGGSAANTAYGLFGVLDGATVRNLTVGAALGDASALKVTASGGTAEVGVIAGVCRDANVSDCVNYAKIEYDGTSAARVSAAMVGFIFSETEGTKLERLQNYGAVEADTHGNSANGAGAAIHMAGICGFATGNATNKICNDIAYCDNYGNITSNSARSSGIVAAANNYTRINSCVNHGNQLNSCGTTGRLGNITCITGTGCSMTDCINNGNLVSTGGARCGGLLSLANHATNSFSGCANYGEILTDDANRGVFFGYSAYATSWINCIAGGKVGVYNGGTAVYDSYGENEQVRYLGVQKSTDPINADNITYMIGSSSGGSGGGDDVEPTLRILFIGNSFTKDAVEHLPKMVSAADIPTLKMVHLYYGGRTIPEYADGYATKSDYTCYKYNPGTSLWLSYTGYNIQQIVKSDTWDIVCLQEHTGNSCGWIWNDTEKNAIQGLIADIRADQNGHTPKFVYIMSQAYFNMDKIGTAQRPYKNFTTQDEMFDVIVAQARKVLDQTDVEQIIPTGTVLQNLRTSSLNNDMDLTRDGYHMDYGLSRYAAACAVFESIISPSFGGKKLDGNSFRYNVSSTTDGTYTTPVTDDNQPVALQAARYALATPFAVTDMSSGTQTPGNGIEDTDFENDSNKE